MPRDHFRRLFWLGALTLLAGCTLLQSRQDTADAIARAGGLARSRVEAAPFTLTAYSRLADPGATIVVYIEGDGLAWLSRSEVSADPTPRNPVGLALAALDSSPNVIYLARPCQYPAAALDHRCHEAYWTERRFSEEVVASVDGAISRMLPRGHRGLHLAGYSGGAAVAALVAARRSDVLSLTTVAGNLDHEALNRHHKVTPLAGSLNAADVAPRLAGLPQVHWVGERDSVVPPWVAEGFAARAGDRKCIAIRRVPGATHETGWTDIWAAALSLRPACGVPAAGGAPVSGQRPRLALAGAADDSRPGLP